nr:F-box protein At1g10780-like [Tanacetum cinerariifolium]
MDCLPEAVVQHILSTLRNAKDVASCNCVSKKWKDSMSYIGSIYFQRSIFDHLSNGQTPDNIISKILSSSCRLEELVVYCPFTSAGLASWLSLVGSSLKSLELRMDNLADENVSSDGLAKLECIQAARNLESLRLWGVLMVRTPKWDVFRKLRNLQIVGAKLEDSVLTETLRSTPNLTQLVLLGCEGLRNIRIKLLELEHCKLDFYGLGSCSLTLKAPKIEYLEVQGCSWIRVRETSCLKNLSIANSSGRVYMLDFEIDFVDFFKSHPRLKSFEIHGAMFAALCQTNSLKNLHQSFAIPCLEELVITVRSPLNAEQKMSTLESFVKCGKKLKKMRIRILQMKSGHNSADDFFEDICMLRFMNHKLISLE